jgi:hypothetical protein
MIEMEMQALQDKPIVHLHIPKTAGTSLRRAFERAFGQSRKIFSNPNEREYLNGEGGLVFDGKDYGFVSGHIGFDTANKIGGSIVTLARYPVDRYISTYFFWRQLYETGVEISRNTQLAIDFSLDEFVKIKDEPSIIEEFADRMTWQIAFGSRIEQRALMRARGSTDDDIFQSAIKNVDSFEIVGVQERMWTFCSSIEQRFGIKYEPELENVTKNKMKRNDLRVETLRNIYKWLEMDMAIYEHILLTDLGNYK